MRHTRAEIEHGAEISEDLAPGVEAEGVLALLFGLAVALVAVARAAAADPPAEDAGGADEDDGEDVEGDGLERGCWGQVLRGGRVGWCGGFEQRRGG